MWGTTQLLSWSCQLDIHVQGANDMNNEVDNILLEELGWKEFPHLFQLDVGLSPTQHTPLYNNSNFPKNI